MSSYVIHKFFVEILTVSALALFSFLQLHQTDFFSCQMSAGYKFLICFYLGLKLSLIF